MAKIDEFGKELNIGDVVLFNNQDSTGDFRSHQFGVILGFTKCFIIIRPDNPDKIWGGWHKPKLHVYRKPKYVVLMNDHKYMNLFK